MEQTLDISSKTILKIFLAGFILYMLFLARDIVIWFCFALVISLLVSPAINFLRFLRLPKILSAVLVYLSVFGVLSLIIYLISPIFVFELNELSKNIPDYFEKVNPLLKNLGFSLAQNFDNFVANLIVALQESSGSIIKAGTVFFGGIASTILIFILAFYISLEDKGPERFLSLLIPKKYEHHVISIFERAQGKVSRWFGARILACIFVGLASFIVFYLLDIQYSFTLALISGVLNFVPFIGPLITAILAILFVGVSHSWLIALYIAVVLYIIQAVENNFVTPLLMKKILDLPPILVLIALLFGGIIFGVLGMIFAVPVFGIIYEFTKEFLEKRREEQEDGSQIV